MSPAGLAPVGSLVLMHLKLNVARMECTVTGMIFVIEIHLSAPNPYECYFS